MVSELSFVPKILLCGDEAEFFSRVGNRPLKIVGRVQVFGEVDGQPLNFLQDGKIFLDGKPLHVRELLNMLRGGVLADYFVFTSLKEFSIFYNALFSIGFRSARIVTLDQFKNMPREFFYDIYAELQLLFQLKNFSIKTLLDADACFAKGELFTKMGNDFTTMDCISDKPLLPIKENFYRRIYKDFAEVGFRHYDAVLIAERPPVDFMSAFAFLENFSERVITFARTGSELEKYIRANLANFAKVDGLQAESGNYFFLTRHMPKEDFCIYVVTHKALPPEHVQNLPEGYKVIQSGRAINPDLGYLGDNTGDNISHLNPYLNEYGAMYWYWKNANHSVVGHCHYRRFFTESDDVTFSHDKILTKDAALKILQNYDIIVLFHRENKNQREIIQSACGVELYKLCETTIEKYLLQVQPDYLDAFDFVLNSTTFHKCNLFVTRRDVFDAYCKWLFSFYIDVTQEILRTVELHNVTDNQRRFMGYFSERMLTVWLMKNRLRIKEMNFMQVQGL